MRILFYIGYQWEELSPDIKTGGGTEIALINVANQMVKFGHEVIISGQVKNAGKVNGVTWMPTENVHKLYYNNIDIIISASYIHFLLEFKEYSAKKVFWVHNTHYHPWYNGVEIEDSDKLLNHVDATVCLTNWHANMWSSKYNIDISNIKIIGNGINTDSFIGSPIKIKNKFIWSSEPSRGLMLLLNQWPKIKSVKPTATLDIYSPKYGEDQLEDIRPIVNMLDGVTIMGNKNQTELHDAMLRAEYWCYITDYEETYCITALEMQYAKVIPIITPTAALKETVQSGIICNEVDETNWNSAILSIERVGSEIKEKVIESNYDWAKCQTWDQRSYEWNELIKSLVHK